MKPKIIDLRTETKKSISTGNIEDGTVFSGKIGAYSDFLFVKLGEYVYSLNHLSDDNAWSSEAMVSNYREIEELKIEVIK